MRISDQTLNRLAVLKAIRRFGPISRSDMPKITGLSVGTISQMTSELLGRGLIVERRAEIKRPGRPRLYLELAEDGAVVVGASITGDNVLTAAFVDLAGKHLCSLDIKHGGVRRRSDGIKHLMDMASLIADCLDTAIEQSPFSRYSINRAAIALPAVVDSARGTVHFMTTFAPSPAPFAETISRRLNLPVTIENDFACMARAEHWFGKAQEFDTFTLIHVGYSVGSAEYADGVAKSGANGLNPEFGHTKTVFGPDGLPCFCGARGCLAMYSSIYGMLKAADMLGDARFPPISSIDERFTNLLQSADVAGSAAAEIIARGATQLGYAVANHLNATDPGQVLLSFHNLSHLELVRQRVEEVIRTNTVPGVFEATNVRFIVANPDWRRTGTAALALEQTYLDGSGQHLYEMETGVPDDESARVAG